jgi:hypothetical protein
LRKKDTIQFWEERKMFVKCLFILFYSSLIATETIPNNLTVEYLPVIYSTVYNRFVSLYGNLSDSSMRTYILDYFQSMIDGVLIRKLFLNLIIFSLFID